MRKILAILLLLALVPTNVVGKTVAIDNVAISYSIEEIAENTTLTTGTLERKSFADVKAGSWYEDYVLRLYEENYTSGVGKDKAGKDLFGVRMTLTNAEILTFMLRIINQSPTDLTYNKAMGESWFTPYYYKGIEIGLVTLKDMKYANDKALRKDVFLMMYKAIQLSTLDYGFENKLQLPEDFKFNISHSSLLGESTKYYRDYKDYYNMMEIPFEYINAVNFLYNRGILVGNDKYESVPNGVISREETAAFLVRIFDESFRVWAKPYTDKIDPTETKETIPQGVLVLDKVPTKIEGALLNRVMSYDIVPIRKHNVYPNGNTEDVGYYAWYDIKENMPWWTVKGVNYRGTPNLELANKEEIGTRTNDEYNAIYFNYPFSTKDPRVVWYTKELESYFNADKSDYTIIADGARAYLYYSLNNVTYREVMYFKTSDLASCKIPGVTKANTYYEVMFDFTEIMAKDVVFVSAQEVYFKTN